MTKLMTKGKNASPLDGYKKRKLTAMNQNSSKPAYVPEDLRNSKISELTALHLPEKDFAWPVALYPQINGSSIRWMLKQPSYMVRRLMEHCMQDPPKKQTPIRSGS